MADSIGVRASLDVFKQTSIAELREKSLKTTKYLEDMLDHLAAAQERSIGHCFSIITPRNPDERGAQISVLLKPGMLDSVMESLEENGVVVDERRPDVIRVAPAPAMAATTAAPIPRLPPVTATVFPILLIVVICQLSLRGRVLNDFNVCDGRLLVRRDRPP